MQVPVTEEPADEARLNFIRPRETARIARARDVRRSRLIGRLRIWLPVLAAVVIGVLFAWPKIAPNFRMKNIVKNVPNLVIDNLHYSGVDDKNEPYSLTAAQATKPSDMHGIYDLTKPEGEITLQNGAWLDGKAAFGRYDEINKQLWLGGNVQLFHDKGYQFTTDEAQVNLNTKDAWGDKPVLIQGPFGTARGVGFRLLDGGHSFVINGPARAILTPRHGGDSQGQS